MNDLRIQIEQFNACLAPLLVRDHVKCNEADDTYGTLPTSKNLCSYEQELAARYLEELIENGVWPYKDPSLVSELLKGISRLEKPEDSDLRPCDNLCHIDKRGLLNDAAANLEILRQYARTKWTGICLDCFKNTRRGIRRCRLEHDY